MQSDQSCIHFVYARVGLRFMSNVVLGQICQDLVFVTIVSVDTVYLKSTKNIYFYTHWYNLICCSAPDTNCTPPAPAGRPHLPDYPAQHQLHHRGWTSHSSRDPVQGQPVHLDWDSCCGLSYLQGLAPGARHRVPDQCPAHTARGGRYWSTWTSTHQ